MSKYDLSAFDKGVAEHSASSEPGMLEAAALGGVQGLTMGFGDELYGAGRGAADVLMGDQDMDLEGLLKAYVKRRDEARAEMKAAEEANPITSTVANVAGSLALPVGLLGQGAKAATLGGKALQAAKVGASAGALAGLGSSNADLTQGEFSKAAADTVESAGIGAGLGAAAEGVVVPALKNTGEFLNKFKGTQKVTNAFQKAREGVEMHGSDALKRESANTKEVAKDIGKQLDEIKKYAGSVIGDAVENSNQKVNVEDKYKELIKKLDEVVPSSPEDEMAINKYKSMLNRLTDKKDIKVGNEVDTILGRPEATAKEINDINKPLKGMLRKNKNLSYEAQDLGGDLSSELKGLTEKGLNEVDQMKFGVGNEGYAKSFDAQSKIGGLGSEPGANLDQKLAYEKQVDNLHDTIQKTFAKPGDISVTNLDEAFASAKSNIENINDSLAMTTQDPEQIAKLKMTKEEQLNKIKDLQKRVKEAALNMSTSYGLSGTSPFEGSGIIKQLTGMSGEAAKLQTARLAGKVTRFAETTAPQNLKQLTKGIYNASPEMMQKAADTLMQKGSPYAAKFQAVMQQPNAKRNALLFTLMQQPGFRQDLEGVFGSEN